MPAALLEFIAKHELAGDAAQELTAIWTKSVTTAGSGSVPYQWDEIHKIIETRSAGSSLVIINLPDPPVLSREQAEGADPKQLAALQLEQSVEYMEYMEGLAKNLPRVLYVHGAGQEVIQFE